MARVRKMIVLNDETIHETKKQAEAHLVKKINRNPFIELYGELGRANALEVREILAENTLVLAEFIQIIIEIEEIQKLDF